MLMAAALAQSLPVEPTPVGPPVAEGSSAAVLLFEIDYAQRTLIDAITAFGDPADPLLPLGELTRTLELDVAITGTGMASGRIGAAQRPLTIDVGQHFAAIGANRIELSDRDVRPTPTEIYIRASVLQQLLPLRFAVDADNLAVTLTATEPLPLDERRERQSHRALVGQSDGDTPDALVVGDPYRWLGAPAFDFGVALGTDNARGGFTRRFEGRVAADVLKTSFTGFVGTDDSGEPSSALLRFERRDPDGHLLGPLHATYAAAGDVYTPALAMGARSFGGAGIALSTARISETSVFQRITLRGELPLGYDIELYVNEVLRGAQDKGLQGRYEFVDVPLVRGRNVIRVVTFGPHGERNEQTRLINAGGGQLASGQLALDAGFVLQDRPVIQFNRSGILPANGRQGDPRGVLTAAYGLTPMLTLIGGLAHYTDDLARTRNTGTIGVRTSLAGIAVQADYVNDFGRGSALALALAGALGPISYVVRDAEYRGDFNDETNPFLQPARPLRRSTEAQFDTTLHLFSRNAVPLSLRALRAEYLNGDRSLFVQGRTTVSLLDTLVALGTDYRLDTTGDIATATWSGDLAASRRLAAWQLRAAATFDLKNGLDMRGIAVTADRPLNDRYGLRLGLAKAFGTIGDVTAQAGLNARLPFADATLAGAYSTQQKRWQIGMQLNFGVAFDPFRGSYRITRPGPSSGASAALVAFVDANADGNVDVDERRVADVRVAGTGTPLATNAHGEAFITGLGNSPRGAFRVDSSQLDDVFLTSPPQDVTFAPRPGQVLRVLYPFTPTSEVIIKLEIKQRDGSRVGLSALRFRLVCTSGTSISGSTEFDGTAVLEDVKPGLYDLQLDPEQAERLKMRLVQPVEVVVTATSGSVRIGGAVRFEGEP